MNAYQKLGKYELIEKIGEGGFGIVYRGRDPLLDRDVAIKVLHADKASAPDFVDRFRREARLAASLRHPNIVTVIEVGEQEGRYFLVMDYLPGGTLSQALTDGKPLSLAKVAALLRPLAEAMDYAHRHNIIHRDFKPANVIFADDGQPVLTDFGLVKSLSDTRETTTTGAMLGTVEYMAPEQIQGQEVGPAADRYALGVVAYQMLTGRVPFQGNTPFEIQSGHVHQPPPDPRQFNPGLPAEVVVLLQKALAKQPEVRYSTAIEIINDLDRQSVYFNQDHRHIIVEEGKSAMQRREFETALQKFEQAQMIQTTQDVKDIIVECHRRIKVWARFQDLYTQRGQIHDQIAGLVKEESWLPDELGVARVPSAHDTPEGIDFKGNPRRYLLAGGAITGIFSMFLSWFYIQSSPNEEIIHRSTGWGSFSYVVDYRVIQAFITISILLFLAWLVFKMKYDFRSAADRPASGSGSHKSSRYLLTGAVISSIISMFLAWMYIHSAPDEEIIRRSTGWQSFSYAIDYQIIQTLTIISVLLLFAWLALIMIHSKDNR